MNYLDLTIKEIHSLLLEKKVTVSELVKEALNRAKNDDTNAFEMILEEDALKKAIELDKKEVPEDNLLFGIPYVAKNNFSTKGYETNSSSNVLNGYVPCFDASVITYLNDKDMVLIGKTTLDELAMGGTGTSGHLGTTYNPFDKTKTRLCGGSSCGSASSVASGIVPFALGSDTGDSVRKPASYTGLVGFKPTWGLISRYGLFPFAPSLDHVAYFTRSVFDSALMMNVLSRHDINDSTSNFMERPDYLTYNDSVKGKKVAIINQLYELLEDKVIKDAYDKLLVNLEKEGAELVRVDVSLDLLKAVYPTYIVISCAEATSNNANLDGIKFGPYGGGDTYQDVMTNSRTQGFSPLIKRRFVIGSYALFKENQNEVFLRAQKARRLIVNEFNKIFESCDTIVFPAAPSIAPLIKHTNDNIQKDYDVIDNWLGIGNFGGFPSITLPLGMEDGMPFGIEVMNKPFDEISLFGIAENIEKYTGLRGFSTKNAGFKEGK